MGIEVLRDVYQAKRFMMDTLGEGKSLARLIMRKTDFERGTFRLPMPKSVDQGQQLDLRSGNIRLAKDEERMFAGVIKSFIASPTCALVMQELEASMSDLSRGTLLPYRHLAVPYKNEVYWNVSGIELAQLSEDEMLEVVNSASYLPWTGFFYFDGISHAKAAMDDSDLEHVVTNLLGLAVSAFDYRSFLIWWRDDLYPFPL